MIDDKYLFCGCCDMDLKWVQSLEKLNDAELIKNHLLTDFTDTTYLDGFVGILIDYLNRYSPLLKTPITNPYHSEMINLIRYCLKFLVIDQSLYTQSKNSYITLWSFIYTYLHIPAYPHAYVVMQYMDNIPARELFPELRATDLIEHGSAIRCAWLNSDHREPVLKLTQDIDPNKIVEVMNTATCR